jgi:hypothetical protein
LLEQKIEKRFDFYLNIFRERISFILTANARYLLG